MKKILVVLVLLIAGGIYWLSGNMDYLLRKAIVQYGSEMTKASVDVGKVSIDVLKGEGKIVDLVIGNPAGFKTSHALKVKEISIRLEPASLTKDVVMIREIAISKPNVIYEKGENGTNFETIQRNVAAYTADGNDSAQKDKQDGKKLIVERFVMTGAVAEASAPLLDGKTASIELPDLYMKNIGKAENGVTPGELGEKIATAMNKQLKKSVSFERLGNAIKETGKSAVEAVKSLF